MQPMRKQLAKRWAGQTGGAVECADVPDVSGRKAGRVALVTGAAAGLGNAFARRLALEGATVAAVDRTPAPSLVADLKACGAQAAEFYQADVSDELQVRQFCRALLDRFGRCDILINNAGISRPAPFAEITLNDFRHMMSVNMESAFLTCRQLVPSMIDHKYGRIVNLASGTFGIVAPNFTHYIASKGAVIGFTRGLATDVGEHGITVNCIAPGLTRTPATEFLFSHGHDYSRYFENRAIKRPGAPDDLVGAMSFLTSDDSAFMTGQTLIVDGGELRSI
jgi:NAD(P)-dependent dehydrogenase (short-subunit alcohol dehydrogenase family)